MPGDYVLGDLGNGSVVGESARAEPDQGLSETYAELDRHRPARLVDYEPQVGTGLDFGGELAGRCVRVQGKHSTGGDIGHNQCFGVLVVSEWSRRVTVKAQRAQADCADPKWEAKRTALRLGAQRARTPASVRFPGWPGRVR